MPKELTRKQPSSSLANILAESSVDSATGVPGVHDPVAAPKKVVGTIGPAEKPAPLDHPTGEPANIPRQFGLTKTADSALRELVTVYSDAVGYDLTNAEVFRGVLHAVEHAMPILKREARHIGRQKRLKNSKGNEALRDELERKIGKAFVAGMRAVSEMDQATRS